jgi:hypothetical protein
MLVKLYRAPTGGIVSANALAYVAPLFVGKGLP